MAPNLFSDESDQLLQVTLQNTESGLGDGVHVKLNASDVLNLADESHTLYVQGGVGDSLDAGGGWLVAGQETVDGAVFNVYVQGEAVLKVDCNIEQSLIGVT